jgi:hypothetical protein
LGWFGGGVYADPWGGFQETGPGYLFGDPPRAFPGVGWLGWVGGGSSSGYPGGRSTQGGFCPKVPPEVGSQGTLGVGRREKVLWGWGAACSVIVVGAVLA